ncbi:hypothetical protein ACM0P6_15990 (plasmid) [Komagataeibacter sucrofermentans]|uniref:hypothetical protein n=1 Tax=Komagataeibacter sucrofermentans TaxID=1053551 RepID=UPI0011B7856B|nr:hypothetical protein [Komagataeibacter sucrofermentans]GBQ53664.1 hypothetical protein AA15973_3040 [Komagataeibacter sucrofermentans DSM 15973]
MMNDFPETTQKFFKAFEDRTVLPHELEAWVAKFPEKGKNNHLSPHDVLPDMWELYKSSYCNSGAIPSQEDIKTLIARQRKILSPEAGTSTHPAEAPVQTASPMTPACRVKTTEESLHTVLPADGVEQAGLSENSSALSGVKGQVPPGFDTLFGRADEPLAQARDEMLQVLYDPTNRTEDLYTLLAWCKKQRPTDLFDDYAVTMFANPLPDQVATHPVKRDLYEQVTWAKDNFSEKRYKALIELRDKLRKSGQLLVKERPRQGNGGTGEGPLDRIDYRKSEKGIFQTFFIGGTVIVVLIVGSIVVYTRMHSSVPPADTCNSSASSTAASGSAPTSSVTVPCGKLDSSTQSSDNKN